MHHEGRKSRSTRYSSSPCSPCAVLSISVSRSVRCGIAACHVISTRCLPIGDAIRSWSPVCAPLAASLQIDQAPVTGEFHRTVARRFPAGQFRPVSRCG